MSSTQSMSKLGLNRISQLLPASLIGMALFPALLLSAGIYIFASNFLVDNYLERLQLIAQVKFSSFEEHIRDSQTQLFGESINPSIASALESYTSNFDSFGISSTQYASVDNTQSSFLNPLVQSLNIKDLFLISSSGDVVYSYLREADFGSNLITGPYRDTELARIFNQALIFDTANISDVKLYAPSNEAAHFMVAPILKAEKFIGAIAFQLDLVLLDRLAFDYDGLGTSGEIVVANRIDGVATVISPLRLRENAAFQQTFEDSFSDPLPIIRALNGEEGEGEAVDYRGEEIVAVWSNISSTNLGVVVKMDRSEVFAPITALRNFIILVSILVILTALFLGRIFSNRISSPVSDLVKASKRLELGELDSKISGSKIVEIDELARAFNSMRSSIQSSNEQLNMINAQLESRVKQRTDELGETNKKLRESLSDLEKSQMASAQIEKMAALGTMTAGVGHEVNNPLMGLLNYIEYANKHSTDEKVKEVLGKAENSAERIKEIIKNMMTFSHGSSKNIEAVNLNSIVKQVLDLMAADLRSKNISVQVDVESSLPLASANSNEIQQCLLNLLLNARDALAEQAEKKIQVTSYSDDEFTYIEISDSGGGISEEFASKIFDPFFTTKPAGKGTGLGLSVSSNLVKAYGGELTLIDIGNSEHGAVFRIKLKKYYPVD